VRLFRSAILEYDKKRVRTERTCLDCGTGITGSKRRCLPCGATRLEQTIAANRHKYKDRLYGKEKTPGPKAGGS
jgi:hypothetical protein